MQEEQRLQERCLVLTRRMAVISTSMVRKVEIHSPQDAVKAGIGYLSEDRKRYGLVLDKSVSDNNCLASLENFCKGAFIDTKKCDAVSEEYVKKPKDQDSRSKHQYGKPFRRQSAEGSHLQVADQGLRILIFDEPTRGIDVGAKSEIYALMNELVNQGKSIIMISSEMTEILRMSDRILVMCEGKKTGEISIEEATQEKIMHAATLRD